MYASNPGLEKPESAAPTKLCAVSGSIGTRSRADCDSIGRPPTHSPPRMLAAMGYTADAMRPNRCEIGIRPKERQDDENDAVGRGRYVGRTVRGLAPADPSDSRARSRPGSDPSDGCAGPCQRSAYHPREIRVHPGVRGRTRNRIRVSKAIDCVSGRVGADVSRALAPHGELVVYGALSTHRQTDPDKLTIPVFARSLIYETTTNSPSPSSRAH